MDQPLYEKHKIAILIGSIRTGAGGAEKQAILLTGELSRYHDVILVVLEGNKISPKFQKQLDENQLSYCFLKGSMLSRYFQLFNLFRKKKPDILFCYLTASNLAGGVVGTILRIPYVIGGIRNSRLGKLKLVIQRFTHNHLTHLSVINNFNGSDHFVKKNFRRSKIQVIPNGIEVEKQFYKRPDRKQITIITVGRFVEFKDYRTALCTIETLIRMLHDHNVGIKYDIVGFGPLEYQVRSWINEFGLEKYVQLVLNPTNIKEIYLEADIYLCTSYYEGLSNSVLEAMNYGLPVVGTDVGDNCHLIKDGCTGYLTPPHNCTLIAEKLKELTLDYEARIRMGAAGFEHCRETYSVETLTRNYLKFIEALRL
jgi:glycosyltransferase involved in cell wall biosynthesis